MGFIKDILKTFNLIPDGLGATGKHTPSTDDPKFPEYIKTYRRNGRRVRIIATDNIQLAEVDP
jgi:hypothetical protein